MSGNSENQSSFVFRRNDSVGAAAAEDDGFLADCFIDVGDLNSLIDCENSKRIVVGRTGAGKSALLARVASSREHVVQISPHSLSLNYIANNNVIRFFEEAGVNLSAFYMLLWKHVLVVELLRAKYSIKNEDNQRSTMARLRERLYKKDRFKEQAIEYLETWGNRFWLTTEERMQELTQKVESRLSGSIKGTAFAVDISGEGAKALSTEQRSEIVQRGKRAVSEVQIRELDNIIHVLGEDIFSDAQDHYYVIIDTLDEEWADDRIKYRLIRALIDTVRSFRKVENVKIIAALRQDLLNKVMLSTTDPGFQEEKYESLYLYIHWDKKSLERMIESRVNQLMKRRYTGGHISLDEILPQQIDAQPPLEYMFERTFMRPRDVIVFFNECIEQAEGRTRLTAAMVKHAEGSYSQKRLQSVAYEWQIFYPNLKAVAQMFYGMPSAIPMSDITKEFLAERFQEVVSLVQVDLKDQNVDLLNALYTPLGNFNSIRNTLIRNLFGVGLLGIKTGPTSATTWSTDARASLAPGDVRPNATIYIHPMFYRALGTRL